jgi:hypothetical protein
MSNTLESVCYRARRQLVFNVPSTRIQKVSPYPQYTQEQLNMRRKAEILKYDRKAGGNKLTKKGAYAKLISGVIQTESYTNIVVPTVVQHPLNPILNRTTFTAVPPPISSCPKLKIPQPTSASDVPGPIIYLFEDDSIPLYDYLTNVDAYAIQPPPNTEKWSIQYTENVNCYNTTPTVIASFAILPGIDSGQYSFNLSIPFGIYATEQYNSNLVEIDTTINIVSASCSINYNGNSVYNGNFDLTPVVTSLQLDASLNTYKPVIQVAAVLYAGVLKINNVNLVTNPSLIYDVVLTFGLSSTDFFDQQNASNQTFAVIANITNHSTSFSENCTIMTAPSTMPYTQFTLTGTPST